ncbi:MAG TPA: hypothetical protein EYG57_06750 [Planctomycetes bacterium]|nr:hypothetical protein [Planctomycetota bacterium]
MTTKFAIIASAAIVIGAAVAGLVVLFMFVDLRAGNERAALLGRGFGIFCLVPLGVVWIMWAVHFRKEREKKQRQSPPG